MINLAQSPLNVQAERIADYLARYPDSTAKEIETACDTGCISRVLSAMTKELGYGINSGWRSVPRVSGPLMRRVRTYAMGDKLRASIFSRLKALIAGLIKTGAK